MSGTRLIHPVVIFASVLGLLVVAGCATKPGKGFSAIQETLYLAAAAAEQENDYESAIGYYQKLVLENPDKEDVVLALSRNLRYSGDSQNAVLVLEQADFGDDGEPAFLLEYAKAIIAAGKPRIAIKNLKAAQEKYPENWEVYSLLGIAYDLTEDYGEARKVYEKAGMLSEDNPAILNNRAISLALSGDLDGAIAMLNSNPRLARSSSQIRQNLAFFYGIKGDIDSAEALARMDLDEETIQRNLLIYSQFRQD